MTSSSDSTTGVEIIIIDMVKYGSVSSIAKIKQLLYFYKVYFVI